MTTTIAEVIDRTYRQFLTPPDAQTISTRLVGGIDEATEYMTLDNFAIPEDEQLMRSGVIIELDQELCQVLEWNVGSKAARVKREQYSTVGAPHLDGTLVYVSPPYTRKDVYDAVGDNIVSLYPKLFTVYSQQLIPIGPGIYPLEDELAVTLIDVTADGLAGRHKVDGTIVDFHQLAGGRAVLTNIPVGDAWVRYRRRMKSPSFETDEIDQLGVDERWVNIVVIGTAADLMAGRDVAATQVNWVNGIMQTEGIPVGARSDVAVSLARYRELLIDRFSKEMRGEYKPTVHFRNPFESSRPGLG